MAAQRITVSGLRGGRPLLRFRATWYCTTDLDRAWDVRATGWHITVDGDAPLDIDLRFPVPLDRMAAMSPSYTANRAVNAVPVLCEASPGSARRPTFRTSWPGSGEPLSDNGTQAMGRYGIFGAVSCVRRAAAPVGGGVSTASCHDAPVATACRQPRIALGGMPIARAPTRRSPVR